MAHSDAREGKWRRNWRMEWVASTLHTTSEHGVSSITTADAHTSAASSRLNWRPHADLNALVRFAERRNLVSARVPSHFKRSLTDLILLPYKPERKKYGLIMMVHSSRRFHFPLFRVSQEIYTDDPQPQPMHLFRIQNRSYLSLSIFRRNGYENYSYEICMLIKQSNTVSFTLGDKTRGFLGTVIFIIDVSTRRMRCSKFIPGSHTTAAPIIPGYYKRNRHFQCCIETKLLSLNC